MEFRRRTNSMTSELPAGENDGRATRGALIDYARAAWQYIQWCGADPAFRVCAGSS
jgi:hypothetical protein